MTTIDVGATSGVVPEHIDRVVYRRRPGGRPATFVRRHDLGGDWWEFEGGTMCVSLSIMDDWCRSGLVEWGIAREASSVGATHPCT